MARIKIENTQHGFSYFLNMVWFCIFLYFQSNMEITIVLITGEKRVIFLLLPLKLMFFLQSIPTYPPLFASNSSLHSARLRCSQTARLGLHSQFTCKADQQGLNISHSSAHLLIVNG